MAEEKDNKKILELLKENKELIIMVPTFVLTFLGALHGIIRYFYSLKAEQFYGVPKFYFYDNSQVDFIMKVVSFTAAVMIFLSPLMIKRFSRKNKLNFFESLGYSFLVTFLVFCFSLNFCVSFIINTLHITEHDFVLMGVCVTVSIISWVVYFFVFKTDLTEHLNIDKQETKKDKNKKDAPVDLKAKENKIMLAFVIVATISIAIIMFLMFNSTLFTPNNKKDYEIIQVVNLECNVIIGYYKNSAIIMKGKIDYQNNNLNGHLKIKKGRYRIESTEERNLVYCGFDLVTCENK